MPSPPRERARGSAKRPIFTAITVVALVGAAQGLMPLVDSDAVERSRPRNVPKEALPVGGALRWWQHCEYDSKRQVDDCQIWNRGGVMLEQGEFVPYDGGAVGRARRPD